MAQAIEALAVQRARETCAWDSDRMVGALRNVGSTISDQTVGNILQRHGLPPDPERQKTMRWLARIRLHMEVVGATHCFPSPVWRRLKLGIAFLLVFVHVVSCRHPTPLMAMTASLTTWFAHWDAHVEHWIGAVIAQ